MSNVKCPMSNVKKGFTIIELVIVIAVISILISAGMVYFRGLQDEAYKTRAQGDLKVLKIAIESYYKNNHSRYPLATSAGTADWEEILLNARPRILESLNYDPFGETRATEYVYKTSTDDLSTAKYYIVYSRGISRAGTAGIDLLGTVTVSNEVIWESNGHEQ